MSDTRQHPILTYLRRVFGATADGGVSDAELLRRFVSQRDEAAFELLLWRHAAMVLHVCRRLLREMDAVEDAFQATFLVFVRKAGSISRRESLGGWLYRVAYRIALKAREQAAKRQAAEHGDANIDPSDPSTEDAAEREVRRIVCEEVDRLPARYRTPIVACFFEGKTHEEAARQLGWPRGTVASRLSRGRELLRRRLLRRGIAVTAATLATALAAPTSPAALTGLIRTTIQIVKLFAAGSAISPNIAAFTEGVLQAMYWTRVKIVMVVLLLAGVGGVGTAFWAVSPRAAEPMGEAPPRAGAAAAPADDKAAHPEDADKLTRDMAQSRLNLRKLAMAMHAYASANKGFLPPPALINKEGQAVLSWRVLILPYLGERALYEQFKLSEPWDGPNNKQLLSKMPKVFALPGIKTKQHFSTFYQVFVSPRPKGGRNAAEEGGKQVEEVQAAFVQGHPQRLGPSFPDGISMTLLLVESGNPVPWTKPEDLPYAADKPLPELGGLFRDVFHVVQVDGGILILRQKDAIGDEHKLRAFITRNGGETVYNLDTIEARSTAAEWRRRNRKLRQDRDVAREYLRRMREERAVLFGRPVEKRSPDAESVLEELKKENARLRKELAKIHEESRSLFQEMHRRLQQTMPKNSR